MYHVKLNICLAGIPEDKIALWRQIPAKPRFEHEFRTITGAQDVPNPIPDENQYLIVISQESDLNLQIYGAARAHTARRPAVNLTLFFKFSSNLRSNLT